MPPTSDAHDHEDLDALRAALVGRSVTAVKTIDDDGGETLGKWGPRLEGEVHLDNGHVLKLAGNGPDCACSAGEYNLTQLNDMPINGITNVEVVIDDASTDEHGEGPQTYRLFVLAQDSRIELATFDGDDGNGYYGTGFWFTITAPDPADTGDE